MFAKKMLPYKSLALACLTLSSWHVTTTTSEISSTTILSGDVVVPVGGEASGTIKVTLSENMTHDLKKFTIQSHGVDLHTSEDYFKVEGTIDCIHAVSNDAAILSGTVWGSAMHRGDHFLHIGDTIVFAVADNGESTDEVSIISKIAVEETKDGWTKKKDCHDYFWSDFEPTSMLSVIEGDLLVAV